MIRLHLLLFILISTVLNCSSQNTQSPSSNKPGHKFPLKTYTSETKGFSIGFPANWKIKEGDMNVLATSSGKRSSKGYQPNINVLLLPGSSPENSLTMMLFVLKQNAALKHHKYDILDEKTIQLRHGEARKITLSIYKKKPHLKAVQYYMAGRKKAYIITFRASKKQFNRYENLFSDIIHSFRLK